MTSPAPTTARISIIGGGPGGLTCARILQRHGIAITVYDGDPDRHARNQGGSLDLYADDGQFALRESGLLEEFFARARPEGQEMRDMRADGTITEHHVPEPGELVHPEIDRGQLRDMLLDSLQPATVRWGHLLEAVSGPVEGPRTLHFADGTTVETDLVIGADGGFSRVRPAVSAAIPEYSGVSFLEAWFEDVENRHPGLSELVGQGSLHAADGTRGVFAQRNSGAHIRVYVMQKVPVDWIAANGLSIQDAAGLGAHLLREYAAWAPPMWQMIAADGVHYVDRPIFALPVPHTWTPDPTVTLLGDAAHLMPPLGVGVNLAMLDASELALALATSATIAEALRGYESTMLPRSIENATRLHHGAEFMLMTD